MKGLKGLKGRAGILVMAAVLTFPVSLYAKEEKVVLEVSHKHTGDEIHGGGCYLEPVMHAHSGNACDGGGCYGLPVYHVHTGDEANGGGCYADEIYHVHQGNATAGGECYQTAVYHVHAGDAAEGGACYQTPVCHVHEGSEQSGGACYQTPVYHQHTGTSQSGGGCYTAVRCHQHTGSAETGGGCYNQPVYHSHEGNTEDGGACFEPVYHRHTESCYQTAECLMSYVGGFQLEDSKEEECYHHGITSHLYFTADYRHQDCPAGQTRESHSICGACNNRDKSHSYQKVICGKDDTTVEGYRLSCQKTNRTVEQWQRGCGKTEASVEAYILNCGKTQESIESYTKSCLKSLSDIEYYERSCTKTKEDIDEYALSCEKTAETVERYERSCGKDESYIDAYARSCGKSEETVEGYSLGCEKEEGRIYGELVLWNTEPAWTKENVILRAEYTSEEPFLELEEEPFVWEGMGVDEGYAGEQLAVSENGSYRVQLLAKNKELAAEELTLEIEVGNIDRTPPAIKSIQYEKQQPAQSNVVTVTAEDVQPDGGEGSGIAADAYSYDGGRTWIPENQYTVRENGNLDIAVRDNCGNIAETSIEITNIEAADEDDEDKEKEDKENGEDEPWEDEDKENGEDEPQEDEDKENGEDEPQEDEDKENGEDEPQEDEDKENEEDGPQDDENNEGGDDGDDSDDEQENVPKDKPAENEVKEPEQESEPAPYNKSERKEKSIPAASEGEVPDVVKEMPQKPVLQEKQEVQEEKNGILMAQPEHEIRTKQLKRSNVTETVVKAVVFTMSSVVLLAVLMYFVYIMLRSIRIYHQDGEGNKHYAGSCIMHKTGDGFGVRIPDMIAEQSVTGQFSLRAGRLFVRRHKGEELMVTAGKSKEAVWIEDEIQLRL